MQFVWKGKEESLFICKACKYDLDCIWKTASEQTTKLLKPRRMNKWDQSETIWQKPNRISAETTHPHCEAWQWRGDDSGGCFVITERGNPSVFKSDSSSLAETGSCNRAMIWSTSENLHSPHFFFFFFCIIFVKSTMAWIGCTWLKRRPAKIKNCII